MDPEPWREGTDAGRRAAADARDEAGARLHRRRLRAEGIVPIEPDARVAAMLSAGELLVAVRRAASLDRRQPAAPGPRALEGDLYLTTHRLLHLGRVTIAICLDDVVEAGLAEGRLVLQLDAGRAITIDVDDPRHLRVEMAAARAVRRDTARARLTRDESIG